MKRDGYVYKGGEEQVVASVSVFFVLQLDADVMYYIVSDFIFGEFNKMCPVCLVCLDIFFFFQFISKSVRFC